MPDLHDSFSVAHAAALGGPDWLQRRRRVAAEEFCTAELPSPSEEEWRYSPVAELHLENYRPAPAGGSKRRRGGATGPVSAGLIDSGCETAWRR